jgi:hypothetical protein
VPLRPTAWHAVGVVNFAQTGIATERILSMRGRQGECSTDARRTRTNLGAYSAEASDVRLDEWL